jgi:hypothetical protein
MSSEGGGKEIERQNRHCDDGHTPAGAGHI